MRALSEVYHKEPQMQISTITLRALRYAIQTRTTIVVL